MAVSFPVINFVNHSPCILIIPRICVCIFTLVHTHHSVTYKDCQGQSPARLEAERGASNPSRGHVAVPTTFSSAHGLVAVPGSRVAGQAYFISIYYSK